MLNATSIWVYGGLQNKAKPFISSTILLEI